MRRLDLTKKRKEKVKAIKTDKYREDPDLGPIYDHPLKEHRLYYGRLEVWVAKKEVFEIENHELPPLEIEDIMFVTGMTKEQVQRKISWLINEGHIYHEADNNPKTYKLKPKMSLIRKLDRKYDSRGREKRFRRF